MRYAKNRFYHLKVATEYRLISKKTASIKELGYQSKSNGQYINQYNVTFEEKTSHFNRGHH